MKAMIFVHTSSNSLRADSQSASVSDVYFDYDIDSH